MDISSDSIESHGAVNGLARPVLTEVDDSQGRRSKNPQPKRLNVSPTPEIRAPRKYQRTQDQPSISSNQSETLSAPSLDESNKHFATANDLYQPYGQFFDLGYVTNSLESYGIKDGAWTCVCYRFSFSADPSWLESLEQCVRESHIRQLQHLTHFRVIWWDQWNSKIGDGSKPRTAVLIDSSICAATGLPPVIHGTLTFPDVPDDNRPNRWTSYRQTCSSQPVDALRHFAVDTLEDDHLEPISLPSLPKWFREPGKGKSSEGFKLRGKIYDYYSRAYPRVLPILTRREQRLYFVSRGNEEGSVAGTISVEVFLTDGFFGEASLMGEMAGGSLSETSSADFRRLHFLCDSCRPSVLTDSPFLESLLIDKNFQPSLDPKSGSHLVITIDPNELEETFNHVKAVHADQSISTQHDPQHDGLLLTMHDYQKRAVTWMVQRELAITRNHRKPHPLYFPLALEGGKSIYFHHLTSEVAKSRPELPADRGGILADEMGLGKTLEVISLILTHPKARMVPYLSAEMVMGKREGKKGKVGEVRCYCVDRKAVEHEERNCELCGALQHADCLQEEFIPEEEKFLCNTCLREQKVNSKTTLVVAPAAIIQQWESEIKKSCHAGLLSLYHYRGISLERYISPWQMAQYDVVLASYEMLSKELPWINSESRKAQLRHASVHQVIPSPLLSVKFYRFVLDEAQMVESQTSNYAKMAKLIDAEFYWAVSGTPVQRSISDLQALLDFISVRPWNDDDCFHEYLAEPFRAQIPEPLWDVLGDCMWRLEKRDVGQEMALPICSNVVHMVNFSGIEKQLYQQVYRDCVHVIAEFLRKNPKLRQDAFSTGFTRLDRGLVKVVKEWMGTLAKLCTSPTKVSYMFKVTKKVKKAESTCTDDLGRVSQKLTEKAKLAFENTIRICLMNRNALAAYFWLESGFAQAAAEYRTAKRTYLETEQDGTVDILQKLHILTNLGELLTNHRDSIPDRTIEDEEIPAQASALRMEYVTRKRTVLSSCVNGVQVVWHDGNGRAFASAKDIEQAIGPLCSAIEEMDVERHSSFLSEIKLATVGRETSMAQRIDMIRNRPIAADYKRKDGLIFTLQARWTDIVKERLDIHRAMTKMIEKTTQDNAEFADHCAICHLRNWGVAASRIDKCGLCVVEKSLDAYGNLIFDLQTEIGDDSDADENVQEETGFGRKRQTLTTERDGDFEVTVKAIIQFIKKKCPEEYSDASNEFQALLRILTVMKREYKQWRELWMSMHDYTATNDEIKQAVTRVRFMTEDEVALKADMKKRKTKAVIRMDDPFKWLIPPTENVSAKIGNTQALVHQNVIEMSRAWTHFKFTRNMQRAYSEKTKLEEEDCLICRESVKENWALFPCAHVVCADCRRRMLAAGDTGSPSRTIACPICRKPAKASEILTQSQIVNPRAEVEVHKFNSMQLRGAPSKVEAVVRAVFELLNVDATAKILIFSDFGDVLEDYSRILQRNGLLACLVKSKNSISASITKLRNGSAQILLMPISMGGKGLTITEANHLFFLEPLTNKGVELQAIGRIHRMGQTRPTFIHKFIVADTVEERIFHWMDTVGEEGSLSQQDMTLGQILDLLRSSISHGPDMADLTEWLAAAKRESGLTVEWDESQPSTSSVGPTDHCRYVMDI